MLSILNISKNIFDPLVHNPFKATEFPGRGNEE